MLRKILSIALIFSSLLFSQHSPIQKPDLYILSVGISNFKNPIFDLNYASKDAEDIVKRFQTQKGKLFKRVHSYLLTNNSATRENIYKMLQKIYTHANSNDFTIIYFSTHSIQDVQREVYLQTFDGNFNNVESRCIRYSNLLDYVSRIYGKKLVLLDVCGLGRLQRITTKEVPQISIRKIISRYNKYSGDLTIIVASSYNELAGEIRELKHGVFTYSILRALSKYGDSNRDGVIFLKEFVKSLKLFNEEICKKYNWYQDISTQPETIVNSYPIFVYGSLKTEVKNSTKNKFNSNDIPNYSIKKPQLKILENPKSYTLDSVNVKVPKIDNLINTYSKPPSLKTFISTNTGLMQEKSIMSSVTLRKLILQKFQITAAFRGDYGKISYLPGVSAFLTNSISEGTSSYYTDKGVRFFSELNLGREFRFRYINLNPKLTSTVWLTPIWSYDRQLGYLDSNVVVIERRIQYLTAGVLLAPGLIVSRGHFKTYFYTGVISYKSTWDGNFSYSGIFNYGGSLNGNFDTLFTFYSGSIEFQSKNIFLKGQFIQSDGPFLIDINSHDETALNGYKSPVQRRIDRLSILYKFKHLSFGIDCIFSKTIILQTGEISGGSVGGGTLLCDTKGDQQSQPSLTRQLLYLGFILKFTF